MADVAGRSVDRRTVLLRPEAVGAGIWKPSLLQPSLQPTFETPAFGGLLRMRSRCEATSQTLMVKSAAGGASRTMQAERALRYSRKAGRRICIDLLSIQYREHAEVVTAIVVSLDNS